MNEKRYTLKEIEDVVKVDPLKLNEWISHELIVPTKEENIQYFVEEDVLRLRVIRNLIDDLDVNVEGVEVVLRMRDKMIVMEQWMKKVFTLLDEHHLLTEDLVREFKKI